MNEQADELRDRVRDRYAAAATAVTTRGAASCCGTDAERTAHDVEIGFGARLYAGADRDALPAEAVAASLGCGNPLAVAELHEGETVLDLGSGGGIDVLLSARRVGPAGKAYGVDMTEEMLALARENAARAGAANVEFVKGTIEAVPLPDASVDVVISNCVINLSTDKDAVLREAFRVLKPGGRFAVSDVVVRGDVPAEIRRNMELWVGCIAGALEEQEFADKLTAAGFTDVEIEPWRVYDVNDARAFLAEGGVDVDAIAPLVKDRFVSAFVRATRPAAESCCGPSCCK